MSQCRRRTGPRPYTISTKRLTKRSRRAWREAYPEAGSLERPRRRSDCEGGPRPCPFVGCQHHLYLDVHPETGSIKINHPGAELENMPETCALDVAAEGGATLERVARMLNVTRERVRQIIDEMMPRLAPHMEAYR